MDKPLLLDLFCGAGGAAEGYHRAGFVCVGVDLDPKPLRHYPFEAWQDDALGVLDRLLAGDRWHGYHLADFDVIHASPPCQTHTELKRIYRNNADYARKHVDLIPATRQRLIRSKLSYVIENTIYAPLINPILLCGAMFGLKVYRHRIFETNPWMLSPGHIPHHDKTPAIGHGISPKGFISVAGDGGYGFPGGTAYARTAMGIDWMTRAELSQAIPPAYTEYLGRQLLAVIPERTRKAS